MADNLTTPIPDGTLTAWKDLSGTGAGPYIPRNLLIDQAGADAMGLVSAPTGNTLLGLLSAIEVNTSGGGGGGDATAANQVTGNNTLASILAKLIASPATEATLAAVLAKLSADPATQTTLAAVLTKLNASIAVTGTFWQATQPVSGPLTDTQLRATAVPVSGTFWQATQPVSLATVPALVAGSAVIGKVGIDQTTDGTTNKVNIDASLKSGTATRTTVASGITSVSILASNANRKGAMVCNSDANALLLDLSGGTAAATRYQKRLLQYESYEIPAGYTGAITGIWEADGTGQADVVEFT